MTRLTDLAVKSKKPKDKRYSVSDNGSGLWLVVQPSGHKSYVTWTRLQSGRQIKVTHGDADALSLADARVANSKAIQQAKQGNDPRDAKRLVKAKRLIAEANTFAAVAMKYLDSDETKELGTVRQIRDRLERLAIPLLGDKPVADIRRSNIVDALDRIAHNNGRTQANRTLSTIRCVLDFYGNRDDDYRPPQLSKLNRKLAARDRVLKDDEIKLIWDAGDRFANFLLLTAARRSEVAGMQWKEIVGSDWILPAARNQKTGLDLVRPLSKRAMALLPKRGDDDAFVFGHVPDKPLRGYGSLKRRLDAASGVTGWRLHDLRRTARTLLSRARVSVDHAERCLGHIVGGVRGIYDRHEFHAEKADAFEALSRQIGLIVNPPAKGSNVRQLRRA